MGSLNHVQFTTKPPDTPSPSSAFEADTALDSMEITTLVNAQGAENSDNENGRLPDVVVETKMFEGGPQLQETYLSIAIQVFIPFLIAGFGMVFAGLVLDKIQVRGGSFVGSGNIISRFSTGLFSRRLQS